MPQKNKTNNSKKNLENYRTRTTRTQPTITHARYSVVFRPEQDPPSYRARITAGGDRYYPILDSGASAHFIPLHE